MDKLEKNVIMLYTLKLCYIICFIICFKMNFFSNYVLEIISYLFGLPIFCYFIKNYKEKNYFLVKEKIGKKEFLHLFILRCFMQMIEIFLVIVFNFNFYNMKEKKVTIENNTEAYMYILLTIILAPIIEEIIFRGIMTEGLKKYGNRVVIIVTAILFALLHFNVNIIIPIIIKGIFYSYVANKYSLKYSILCHSIDNFLTAIMKFDIITKRLNISKNLLTIVLTISYTIMSIIFIFFLLSIFQIVRGKYKDFFNIFKLSKEDRKNMILFVKENYIYLIIIFFIVTINWLYHLNYI